MTFSMPAMSRSAPPPQRFSPPADAAVEPDGLRHVVGAVLHEAHQPRQVHLAVLRGQELLQIVIAQAENI